MTVAERERQRLEIYHRVLPLLVQAVLERGDLVAAAERIASDENLAHAEVYRWIQDTEEQIDRARRRRAVPGLLAVWSAGFAVTAGGVHAIFRGLAPFHIVVALAALVAAVFAATLLRDLRRRSADAWLRAQIGRS